MMDQSYEMALSEVDEILNFTESDLVNKIPISFRDFIKNNKNKNYTPNIITNIPISEQKLLKETEAILSLIFRSYWATEEEKKEFEKQDAIELQKKKENTQIVFHNYNSDNNVNNKIKQESTAIAVIENEPWYKKAWVKILKIFNKKYK